MAKEKFVKITEIEYFELLSDQDMLNALIDVGVTEWEGWDDAIDILREDNEQCECSNCEEECDCKDKK